MSCIYNISRVDKNVSNRSHNRTATLSHNFKTPNYIKLEDVDDITTSGDRRLDTIYIFPSYLLNTLILSAFHTVCTRILRAPETQSPNTQDAFGSCMTYEEELNKSCRSRTHRATWVYTKTAAGRPASEGRRLLAEMWLHVAPDAIKTWTPEVLRGTNAILKGRWDRRPLTTLLYNFVPYLYGRSAPVPVRHKTFLFMIVLSEHSVAFEVWSQYIFTDTV